MAQISRTELALGQQVNGSALTIGVFTVDSGLPGPKVYIQANVHGAEIQGNGAIYVLLKRLESVTVKGQIVIVPLANPLAINYKAGEYTHGRFDPITGENWNRLYHCDLAFLGPFVEQHLESSDETIISAFRSELLAGLRRVKADPWGLKSGQHVCLTLQEMALQADYVLDLHTGPASSQHLYVAEYSLASAKHFNIPHLLVVPNGFAGALDEACFVPWWTLSEAFAQHGRQLPVAVEAYTVELGSQETLSMAQAEGDVDSLMSYLSYQSVFADVHYQAKPMTRYACPLANFKTLYAPGGGLVDYQGQLGEILPAGAPIATLLQVDRYGQPDALQTLNLPMPVLPILHCASGSVQQGTELYKVFTQFEPITNGS